MAHLLSSLDMYRHLTLMLADLVCMHAGFDDPDVMKAVAEVARDPSSFAKHANNPKVWVCASTVLSCLHWS